MVCIRAAFTYQLPGPPVPCLQTMQTLLGSWYDVGLHCRPHHIDRLDLSCRSGRLAFIGAVGKEGRGLEESFGVLLTSVEGVILVFG